MAAIGITRTVGWANYRFQSWLSERLLSHLLPDGCEPEWQRSLQGRVSPIVYRQGAANYGRWHQLPRGHANGGFAQKTDRRTSTAVAARRPKQAAWAQKVSGGQ